MQLHHNVLSTQLLEEVEKEIISNFDNACWRVGGLAWHIGLKEGMTGEVLQTPASSELKTKIDNELKNLYPSSNTQINFCLYGKGAGLAIHNDAGWNWAATIYLNREWNKNLGGIFLYSNSSDAEIWNAIFPTFNNMVINDCKEQHMVTPVSLQAQEYRASIQIWGIDV